MGAKKYLNDNDCIDFGTSKCFKKTAFLSPDPLITDVNNYNPIGFKDEKGKIIVSVLRLFTDGTGDRIITGLLSPSKPIGAAVTIQNVGNLDNIIIANNSYLSSPKNRFILNYNMIISPNESVSFVYDEIDLRWRHIDGYK